MKAKSFLIIILLIVAGCKKETTSLPSGLQGVWELVSVDGGWIGHQEYAAGNGNIFVFKGNAYSRTIKIADSTYKYSGTFSIYSGKPCDYASKQTLIKFTDNDEPSSFSLTGEQLIIGATQCIADGTTLTYRKIQ